MYKSSLLQLILIIVGIFTAVAGVQHLFGNFLSILIWRPDSVSESAILGLLVSGAYFLIAFFLIIQSKDWAEYISKRSRLHGDFSIVAKPKQVIYFILIGLGMFSLLGQTPSFIHKLYEAFAGKIERFSDQMYRQPASSEDWMSLILNTLCPLLLILFARPIADYFALKMDEELLEIKEENKSADNF